MKISYQNQANISNKSLNIRKPAVLLASYENYPAANTSGRDANSVHLNFCGGISRTVIRELDKVKDPMEFVKQACNILRKDAGFTKDISPAISINNAGSKRPAYDLSLNSIVLDSESLNAGKPKLFGILSREFRHVVHCYDALRSEGLGNRVIEMLADRTERVNLSNFLETIKTNSIDDLLTQHKNKQISRNFLVLYLRGKQALGKGKGYYKEFEQHLYDAEIPLVRQDWLNLQSKIINSLGGIKKGSKPAKDAEKYFVSLLNSSKSANKDYISAECLDALRAGGSAYLKYLLYTL